MPLLLGGDEHDVRFSYWEYQALLLALAGTMCLVLVAIELMMRRFQVLPMLFPGMFSIRGRRLYLFDTDVDDVAFAKRLRGDAKLLVRVVVFVTLSYLWQQCVLETDQTFGKEFPSQQCDREMDCFAAEIHISTMFTRAYEPIDCTSAVREPFKKRTVVSCIAFVQPTATNWLMHLGIAHSIMQLFLKAYEVLVWATGRSRMFRHTICVMVFLSCFGTVWICFMGSVTNFTSSWLSVVTTFSVPIFLYTVWRTGRVLLKVLEREAQKVQNSIEEHLNLALAGFEPDSSSSGGAEQGGGAAQENARHSLPGNRSYLSRIPVAKSLLKAVVTLPDKVDKRLSWGRAPSKDHVAAMQQSEADADGDGGRSSGSRSPSVAV